MAGTYCTPAEVGKRLGLGFVSSSTLTGTASGTTIPLASSETQRYKIGMVVRVWDDDAPVGATATITAITAGTSLTVSAFSGSYTVAASAKVQIQSAFDLTSRPDHDTVDDFIEDAEETIFLETNGVSYVPKVIPDRGSSGNNYAYYDIGLTRHNVYLPGHEIDYAMVHLGYRDVVPFVVTTDALEIWDGTSWVDLLTGYTESRSGDWWADYGDGVVHFLAQKPLYGSKTIRARFRVGDVNVPGWARRAAAAKAGLMVLESDGYAQLSIDGDGTGRMGLGDVARSLSSEYDRLVTKMMLPAIGAPSA